MPQRRHFVILFGGWLLTDVIEKHKEIHEWCVLQDELMERLQILAEVSDLGFSHKRL